MKSRLAQKNIKMPMTKFHPITTKLLEFLVARIVSMIPMNHLKKGDLDPLIPYIKEIIQDIQSIPIHLSISSPIIRQIEKDLAENHDDYYWFLFGGKDWCTVEYIQVRLKEMCPPEELDSVVLELLSYLEFIPKDAMLYYQNLSKQKSRDFWQRTQYYVIEDFYPEPTVQERRDWNRKR